MSECSISVAYFYFFAFLQSSDSDPLSHLDEDIYDFSRLSRYIHLSHVNNGFVVLAPRASVLLPVNDSTVTWLFPGPRGRP